MKYLIFGYEVGDTGTPHLQGVVIFKNQISKPSKYFTAQYHFEPMRGTPTEAVDYCKKDGTYHEQGDPPKTFMEKSEAGGEANRQRYFAAFEAAKSGLLADIPPDLMTRHYATYKKIHFDNTPALPANDSLNNYWVYGPSGTGKSRSVRDFFGESLFVKNQNKWFDGYKNEQFVLIDDVHPTWTGKHNLKQWSDHYPFPGEIKGGTIMMRPEGIIVTSNYSPEEVFLDQVNDLEPIRRRFKVIKSEAMYDVIMQSYNKTLLPKE